MAFIGGDDPVSGIELELRAVDAAVLTPIVRRSLERDCLEVVEWTFAPFGHSLDEVYGLDLSIVRFSGTARDGDQVLPWAIVLKIVRTPATPTDPASPDNGEREPLAYRTGLLDRVTTLSAPRCFGVSTRGDGSFWMWLEEVVDGIGRQWPQGRYMLAARHLAMFNAAPTTDASAYPWLSRSPLREAVREMLPGVARLAGALDNPLVAEAMPRASAMALLALVDRCEGWLDAMDRLPQAICHWDAHRANLFSRTGKDGQVETVAIDWAGVGWGPLGADLSKMLSQTVNFFGVDAGALPALDAALFEHYLQGLRAAGWTGDLSRVRFAYTAASSMRLVIRTASALRLVFDDEGRAAYERATGQPFLSLARRFSQTLPYYLSLAEEAHRLS